VYYLTYVRIISWCITISPGYCGQIQDAWIHNEICFFNSFFLSAPFQSSFKQTGPTAPRLICTSRLFPLRSAFLSTFCKTCKIFSPAGPAQLRLRYLT
jgi:hypothetical protein